MLYRHYWVEGEHMGCHPIIDFEDGYNNRAWFCPHCGDVWAKSRVDDAIRGGTFLVETQYCRQHLAESTAGKGNPHYPPGGVTRISQTYLSHYPPALLLWELERHLDWFDFHSSQGTAT